MMWIQPGIRCPECGFLNPINAKFCINCGAPLSASGELKCPKCGAHLPPKAKYCPNCGAKVRVPPAARVPPPHPYMPLFYLVYYLPAN